MTTSRTACLLANGPCIAPEDAILLHPLVRHQPSTASSMTFNNPKKDAIPKNKDTHFRVGHHLRCFGFACKDVYTSLVLCLVSLLVSKEVAQPAKIAHAIPLVENYSTWWLSLHPTVTLHGFSCPDHLQIREDCFIGSMNEASQATDSSSQEQSRALESPQFTLLQIITKIYIY